MPRLRTIVAGLAAVTVFLATGWAQTPAARATSPLVPDAPASVAATGQDESLHISWTAPPSDGGLPVTEYRVAAVPRDVAAPTPDIVTLGADHSAVVLRPLVNGIGYDVEVTAANLVGPGSPAAVTAKPHTVPAAPTVESAQAKDSSAIVRWAAPTSDGGAGIRTFVVRAAPSGAVERVPGDRRGARVLGLRNGEPTTFTVTAVNAAGAGVPSRNSAAVTPRKVARFVVERHPQPAVVYGARSRVRVKLETVAGTGVPRQRVNLLARLRPSTRWRQVDSDTTGDRGRVTLGSTLPASAALRVRHPVSRVMARDGAVRSVVVAKRVTASVSRSSTRVGSSLTVKGTVAPDQREGSRVRLQRRVSGSWQRIGTGTMTSRGRYSLRWNPARVGRYVLRMRKPGDSARAAGTSRPWRHTVTPETAADIARDIQRDRGITLATVHLSSGSDGATAQRNIDDVANGRRARTSCSGTAPCSSTTLDRRLLRAVRAMGMRGTITVSEFAGGAHASGSDHYRGRGVDITWVNGRHVGYGTSYGLVVDLCRRHGAAQIFTPANDPWGGHSRHVHCGWS